MKESELLMIAMYFDSSKINDPFYGATVFNHILRGGEIIQNKARMIVSLGDILINGANQDLSPYVIKNDMCTINFRKRDGHTNFKDYLFVWIIEDIEKDMAITLDGRLKKEFEAYIGLSTIDINSTDEKKQFWKVIPRQFSLLKNEITVFGCEEYGFGYYHEAKDFNLVIRFDEIDEWEQYELIELPISRSSSFVKRWDSLEYKTGKNDIDRGYWEMNLSLVKEVGVAGVFIWKAIEDIDKISISVGTDFPFLTEHIFTSLYNASQGVERLQKIIMELIVYRDRIPYVDHKKIEELLMSHNHPTLHGWIISKLGKPNLPKQCGSMFEMLRKFYNVARYTRFTYAKDRNMESTLLQEFGSSCSRSNFSNGIRHLFGKTLGKITSFYYEQIEEVCYEIGIYANELSPESPSYTVFMCEPKDDLYEKLLRINRSKKEVFWWLVNNPEYFVGNENIESYPSLNFDPALINHYLEEIIINRKASINLFNDVSFLYDEIFSENKNTGKERINIMDVAIANPNVYFSKYEELDEEIEEECDSIDKMFGKM
jgi:hypothetical protein